MFETFWFLAYTVCTTFGCTQVDTGAAFLTENACIYVAEIEKGMAEYHGVSYTYDCYELEVVK